MARVPTGHVLRERRNRRDGESESYDQHVDATMVSHLEAMIVSGSNPYAYSSIVAPLSPSATMNASAVGVMSCAIITKGICSECLERNTDDNARVLSATAKKKHHYHCISLVTWHSRQHAKDGQCTHRNRSPTTSRWQRSQRRGISSAIRCLARAAACGSFSVKGCQSGTHHREKGVGNE